MRGALTMLGVVLLTTTACSSHETIYQAVRDGGPVLPDVSDAPRQPYDDHQPDRHECKYHAGETTTTTVGPNVPHGTEQIPFKHVVFLVQENHSFDNYLSGLKDMPGVDVASEQDKNPLAPDAGSDFAFRHHKTKPCAEYGMDLNHEWEATHLQYDEGRLDGFVATNQPHGERAMGYYAEADIPYYYWLARTFGIADRYFSSVLGPTWPNKYYAFAATSAGCTYTPGDVNWDALKLGKFPIACENSPSTSIFQLLSDHNRSYRIYTGNEDACAVWFCAPLASAMMRRVLKGVPIEQFATDCASGTLPAFSYVEPRGNYDDEHPPQDIRLGEAFVKRIVSAVAGNSELWKSTVIFVTYDEHGGYYDHVPPPHACEPGDAPAPTHGFDRYGFRVPFFVISAYNVPAHVSHYITDHTSVLRFVENLFGLGALTDRDANAWPLLDWFDFSSPSFPTFPAGAPTITVEPVSGCPQ